MKTSSFFSAAAVACMIIAAGCSSAPPETDEVFDTRNRAAEYAEFGHRYFEAARYDKALEFYRLSLDRNTAVDNEPGIIKSKNSIGKVYLVTGHGEKAAVLFYEALESSLILGDAGLIAMSSSHVGEYLLANGDAAKALEYFDQALGYAQEIPDDERAILLHNAGVAYRRSGDPSRALSLFTEALAINESGGHLAESASNRYMIASVYSKQGDYENARLFALQALENDRKAESSVGIAKDHRALGLISEKTGDVDAALGHYEKAYEILVVLNITDATKQTLRDLIRIAQVRGKTDDAEKYAALLAQMEEN